MSDNDEAPQLVQLSKKKTTKKEEDVFAAAEENEEIVGASWSQQQKRQSLPHKKAKVSEKSLDSAPEIGGKSSRVNKKKRRRTT